MNFKQFLESDRKGGKSLPETGYKWKYVYIYRAITLTEMFFKHMDYVTIGDSGLKFCIGHAKHQAVVTDEPQHVIKAMVLAAEVFEAGNPGEYFYGGQGVKGQEVPGSRIDPETY